VGFLLSSPTSRTAESFACLKAATSTRQSAAHGYAVRGPRSNGSANLVLSECSENPPQSRERKSRIFKAFRSVASAARTLNGRTEAPGARRGASQIERPGEALKDNQRKIKGRRQGPRCRPECGWNLVAGSPVT
jgi:hypothetical protein